jgi:hypothetical protein
VTGRKGVEFTQGVASNSFEDLVRCLPESVDNLAFVRQGLRAARRLAVW